MEIIVLPTILVQQHTGNGSQISWFVHATDLSDGELKEEVFCARFVYMEELFVDENSQLKAIDFGLSDFVKPDRRLNDIVGSAYYVASEVLHRSYSTEADVWSIGGGLDEPPWPSLSSEAKHFVKRLLNKDPHERVMAAEALSADGKKGGAVHQGTPYPKGGKTPGIRYSSQSRTAIGFDVY
ncbi:hypothetical protein C5167_034518 [Papaver somniferum]|uniref:Protein kinase domain-containing protein n=1 Tax=Papaver somniferum TaxID=3469 RepID=A0A4Y7KG01_PAPSO|nr:hypothetical protein C5167_034518 [Papaver somniferum]